MILTEGKKTELRIVGDYYVISITSGLRTSVPQREGRGQRGYQGAQPGPDQHVPGGGQEGDGGGGGGGVT